jgi:hypothetical protein
MRDKTMPNEIFDTIKKLYEKNNHEFVAEDNFAKEVKQYFTNTFFTNKKGEIQRDEAEKAEFDKILDKAIKKLQKEEREAEQLKGSRTKRVTKAIGQFIKDLSTLGLWRLMKTPTAKTQFDSLVKHATTVANKASGARESDNDKEAYEALNTQLQLALKEKIKPHGRLERNEDIRDKLIKDIAKTCVDKLKKNPMLDPAELFNKQDEIVQFVVDGVEKGANKYLKSWSPIASFNKQADLVASKLSDKLISKHVGRSSNPF